MSNIHTACTRFAVLLFGILALLIAPSVGATPPPEWDRSSIAVTGECLADGVAQAVLQSTGLFTVTLALQPAPSVAVIVTFVPTGIPVTRLPVTVPALAVTVAPVDAVNTTLYTPPPLHTP